MVSPVALANTRQWILNKQEDSKKKLSQWQIETTFLGMFISGAVGFGLFLISKPLAISALILFGLSLLAPLFVQKVPFSKDDKVIRAATEKYENILIDVIFEMIVGTKSIEFIGSILDPDVEVRLLTEEGLAKIFMREVDGEIQFFHKDELILPNSVAHQK